MRVQDDPPLHLTYCLNIHPGESWGENFAAISEKALKVRRLVAPGKPFGLGLRLSALAADELSDPIRLGQFKSFLAANDLYVFTINGFPFGQFHGTPVKESAYAPDWRSPQRRDYTIRLANILAAVLPDGMYGSISTVPLSYKPWIRSQEELDQMVRLLADTAMELSAIARRTGRTIRLALEPEPDCCLETTDEVIRFFTGWPAAHAARHMQVSYGINPGLARSIWQEHVGICLDAAHAAVQFEDPGEAMLKLRKAGVGAWKVQLSSALRFRATPQALARAREFRDPVYLHQVRVLAADGTILSYADLADALADRAGAPGGGEEWRVHFHVPLFFEGDGVLESTGHVLRGRFAAHLRRGATEHLEIETYTFHVLPESLRAADVCESISREFEWVQSNLMSG